MLGWLMFGVNVVFSLGAFLAALAVAKGWTASSAVVVVGFASWGAASAISAMQDLADLWERRP